ncbi:ATP-dependent RNA helicase DEAH12, chloroplastic [Trichonephila inaurata madagascariensis]|uniref:ATP-dependent RNA helicase DEAH12, chloroplastic n=1 Tax=Trichonephila inaurata madagascariensis TaxID=2747483 RepID=A0A8X6XF02_9ARAC|nr:ATP-dependent RNA helicase DEAH12, chloroplastic [Trichonephila inaurata madagascariensis]
MADQSKAQNQENTSDDCRKNISKEDVSVAGNSNSSSSSRFNDKQFEKNPRASSSKENDFTKSIKYQDEDSYNNQKHHFIGTGLYNTDDIEDLPPRYRQKVLKVVDDVVSFFSSKYPEDFELSNSQIKDIVDLNKAKCDPKLESKSVPNKTFTNKKSEAKFDSDAASKSYQFTHASDSVQEQIKGRGDFKGKFNKQNNPHDKNFLKVCEPSGSSSHNFQSCFKPPGKPPNFQRNLRIPNVSLDNCQNRSRTFYNSTDNTHNSYRTSSDSSDNFRCRSRISDVDHSSSCSSISKDSNYCGQSNGKIKDHPSSSLQNDLIESAVFHHKKGSLKDFSNEKRDYPKQNKNVGVDNIKSNVRRNDRFDNKDVNSNGKLTEFKETEEQRNKSRTNKKFSRGNTNQNAISDSGRADDHAEKNSQSSSKNAFKNVILENKESVHASQNVEPDCSESPKKLIKSGRHSRNNRNPDEYFATRKQYNKHPYKTNDFSPHSDKAEQEVLRQRKYSEDSNVASDVSSVSSEKINRNTFHHSSKKFIEKNSSFKKSKKYSDVSCSGSVMDSDSVINGYEQSNTKNSNFSKSDRSDFHKRDSGPYELKSVSPQKGNMSRNLKTSSNEYKKHFKHNPIQDSLCYKNDESFEHSQNATDADKIIMANKHITDKDQKVNHKRSNSDCENTHSSLKVSQNRNYKRQNNDISNNSSKALIDSKTVSPPKGNTKDVSRQITKCIEESGSSITNNSNVRLFPPNFGTSFFVNALEDKPFNLDICCEFSESLILNFNRRSDGMKAAPTLRKLKNATKNLREPHLILVSNFKSHRMRPCDCRGVMFQNCHMYFKDFASRFIKEHKDKIAEVETEIRSLNNKKSKWKQNLSIQLKSSLHEKLLILKRMEFVFLDYVSDLEEILFLHKKFAVEGNLTLKEKFILNDEQFFEFSSKERLALKELLILEEKYAEGRISEEEKIANENKLNSEVELPSYSVYLAIRKLKKNFSYECNSLRRCLPVYSKKNELLKSIRSYSVLVISAETGSGKTTQLTEYLLQSKVAEKGTIICTQPRKIAAISVTKFVCGQLGSAVGKLIGYDVGTRKKYDKDTKIIYMTDYVLLKKFLRNRKLRGISCVIIDEAHERTLYTDLVLGMLKPCLNERLDLRIIITSATIDPSLFVQHFGSKQTQIIEIPGRTYPVEVVWLEKDVEIGWNYVDECVKTAVRIHEKESEGDILVFLTSPGEIDEAIMKFQEFCSGSEMPQLMSLHGKSDLEDQLLVFETNPNNVRKIIFATNAAETSLTIPGIKYVIDSGMTKEMVYFPEKNKNCLLVTFVNKSSADQRKGRAGRTQPGVCYRMYSKRNFEEMPDSSTPEILKTNLQTAMLKLYQFGIEPRKFEFVESPPREAVIKSVESLEQLGLIKESKEKGYCLTESGKKVVELPIEPRLAKLVLDGIKVGIGFETIIMAALVNEAGRLFFRHEDTKIMADKRKMMFCQHSGDLCTYLEIYKRWMEVAKDERYKWCVENFINSKALSSAKRSMEEILLVLHQELGIRVSRRYNNQAFKSHYEKIIFNCFSENLCTFSGHPKMGYFSPYFTESLFIHPSSSLSYLKTQFPVFLVYSTLMQTTRNFLLDVTPIKEDTLKLAFQEGTFKLQVDMLKCLQIVPKTLGPFGESILVRHILGKGGSKIINLETLVEKLINSKNFKIDVFVEKGIILIYLEKRYHETVSQYINNMVEDAHAIMSKEEEMVEMKGSFSYFYFGAGGLITDIIMPGEFKEIIIENLLNLQSKKVEETLKSFGPLQCLQVTNVGRNSCRISAVYEKVASAQKAMLHCSQLRDLKVKSVIHVPKNNDEVLPLYRLQVTWYRCPATGSGWVEFPTEADCIVASGKLTAASFYIDKNYIRFTPTKNEKILDIKNLPPFVNEIILKEKIQENLKVVLKESKEMRIHMGRKKPTAVTEKDMEHVKNELKKLFKESSLIDVKYPNLNDPSWTAFVYYKNCQDGKKALCYLGDNAKIDSFPLQVQARLESHLQCRKNVYEAIQGEVEIMKKRKNAFFSIWQKEKVVNIKFSCKSMEELCDIHLQISQLLHGKTIECLNKKYHYLFTNDCRDEIIKIEGSTKTAIIVNNVRKLISIFGPKENCSLAYEKVCALITKTALLKKKIFSLKASNIPPGFLKRLYSKYGYYLEGLINDFRLKDAKLDTQKGSLTIEGLQSNIEQVEKHLESICKELFEKNSEVKLDENKEICGICFDALTYDFYRLENCGHAFCKTCLLLQIESKVIPLTCVKQGCEKRFFMIDLKKLLSSGSEALRKSFYATALHHHINNNPGEVMYCPSPDCHRIYRISRTGGEFLCLGCKNVICTRCQTFYHYGLSCELFQNIEKDEDYSLKSWMKEDVASRKQCPYCQIVIEKESGCNHMECANCKKHLCWLCLEIFPTSMDVYDHLPFCPKNQSSSN